MSTYGSYPELLHHLHRAALLNERLADRELTAAIGVGRTQYLILRTIDEAPELASSQQRLADHLGFTRAAVSRHILAAEQRCWVATSTERSRREHAIALTEAGRKIIAKGRAAQEAAERRAARLLGVKRLRAATDTLSELCTMLEQRL